MHISKRGIRLASAVGLAILASVLLTVDPSFAQNWNRSPYIPDTTHLRGLLLLIGGVSGFLLGWFFSSHAKEFRGLVIACGCIALIIFALVDNGALGWGLSAFGAILLFFVGIGFWIGQAMRSFGTPPTTFGSARWATESDLEDRRFLGTDGIRLGSFFGANGEQPIQYTGDRHLITQGPTRSGKGTTTIIPNLLSYNGSMLVIDPKGENALITAKHRQEVLEQKVFVVDPWNITASAAWESACFNPMDWLVKGDVDISENALLLADAMIVSDGGDQQFWVEEAKAWLIGLLLYVATSPEEEGQRHLGRVRDLMLLDGEDLETLFKRMLESPLHAVASTGARCLQKEPKLMANVLASLQAQTHFLDSPRIRENVSRSDFSFEDLKKKKITIYLVLPADRLNTFGRWLRLLVQQALTVNARNIEVQPDKPILFMLDEMAALGRLTMIEQAYGLMAGYGMQLWGFVQDLSQLKRIYGEGWQSFIANAGVLQYFGSRDQMSAEYFSKLCGVTTVWNFSTAVARTFGQSTGQGGSSSSDSNSTTDTTSAVQRQLVYPDELMRVNEKKQIVLFDNLNPVIGIKTPWFENPALKDKGVNLEPSGDSERITEDSSQLTVDGGGLPKNKKKVAAKPKSRKNATAPREPNAIDHAVGFVKNKLKERTDV
ncbi:MAG: type IV secretory system conjugative DNA transfer family protein [Roseibium sp.]